MDQNKLSTVILDCFKNRFLFYDCIDHVADKYELYDINALSNSNELFDMIILLKYDENKIRNKIEYAEKNRTNCSLSILKNVNENEQQQQKQHHKQKRKRKQHQKQKKQNENKNN